MSIGAQLIKCDGDIIIFNFDFNVLNYCFSKFEPNSPVLRDSEINPSGKMDEDNDVDIDSDVSLPPLSVKSKSSVLVTKISLPISRLINLIAYYLLAVWH